VALLGGAIGAREYPTGALIASRLLLALLSLAPPRAPVSGVAEHIHPQYHRLKRARSTVNRQRRPGSHERVEAEAELKVLTHIELVEVISFSWTIFCRAVRPTRLVSLPATGGERVALPKETRSRRARVASASR
jgi:hypothetical protein